MAFGIRPVGFQSQAFGDLSLPCGSQGLGYFCGGKNPSFLRKKLHICEIPPNCALWLGFLVGPHLSASPTHLDVALLSFVVGVFSWCQVYFRGNYSIFSCRFGLMCLCKEVSSRSSYTTILNYPIVIDFLGKKVSANTNIGCILFAYNFCLLNFCHFCLNS